MLDVKRNAMGARDVIKNQTMHSECQKYGNGPIQAGTRTH